MKVDDFRRIALSLEGASESAHMGHPDFRVNGRIFATIHHDHKSGMVKLTPEQQQHFVTENPEIFVPENGAWGRAGSTKVMFRAADEDILGEALTLAWQNSVRPERTAMAARPLRKR
jgi:YjbR protein